MKLFILIFSLAYTFVMAEEVSVFGAGDLKLAQPYGLTPSEKTILNNKKDLNKFDNKLSTMTSNLSILNERMDGIESIFNGDSRKLKSVSLEFEQFNKEYDVLKNSNEQLLKQQSDYKIRISKLEKKVEMLVKSIDSSYVTKKQFDELVSFINKQVNTAKPKKSSKSKSNNSIYKKSKKAILKEAEKLFKKDYFTKSKPLFEYLIKNKYNQAVCNFYLGEIHYFRKQYKSAIQKFKISMGHNDQGKYIPKLLLHSAISFEKLNDLDNAANFYGTLIDIYPNTKEAKKAQKNLEKTN